MTLPALNVLCCCSTPAKDTRTEQASNSLVAREFVDAIPNTTISFRMIRLPSDSARHNGAVWIAATEVTWDQYDVFVYGKDAAQVTRGDADAIARPSKPYLPPDRGFGHAGYPAISMSCYAAHRFCQWLSERTGKQYRLPTEAEWENACRTGGDGQSPNLLHQSAWHSGNSDGKTHPVGMKIPDALGVHDMLGNVAEWCTTADGSGVVRGGSYLDDEQDVHCGARMAPSPDWNASDPQMPKSIWWLADCSFVGFRVVCETSDIGGGR